MDPVQAHGAAEVTPGGAGRRWPPTPSLLDWLKAEGTLLVNSYWPTSTEPGATGNRRHEFIVIPSVASARWLLPAEPALAARALPRSAMASIHRRVARALLRASLKAGLGGRLFDHLALLAEQPGPLHSLAQRIAGDPDVRISLHRGTEGPEQKLHAVIFDRSARAVAHVKIACGPAAGELIRHEADILQNTIARRHGPAVLEEGALGAYRYLVLETLPEVGPVGRFGDRHLGLLLDMVGPRRQPAGASSVWDQLELAPDDLPAPTRHRHGFLAETIGSLSRRLSGVELPVTMVHGDFAAWNVVAGRSSLRACDWEHAVSDGLPALDLFHWFFQEETLGRRRSAVSAARALLNGNDWIRSYCERSGLSARLLPTLLTLYLVRRLCQTAKVNARYGFDSSGATWSPVSWVQAIGEIECQCPR